MTQPDLFIERDAWLSDDGVYRWSLQRVWNWRLPWIGWILLNPSTADAQTDDATIRRCMGFAHDWGAGGIAVRNLFAYRSTDPAALSTVADPIGKYADPLILELFGVCKTVVAAWGAGGELKGRAQHVRKLIADVGNTLYRLGPLTTDGFPRHPSRQPRSAMLMPWPYPAGVAA